MDAETLQAIARAGGLISLVLGLMVVAAVVRGGWIFRAEVRNIDRLVAEYVRCRDYLLGNRRPTAESGWRTAEGDAFREAWQNFNVHVDVIRDRHARKSRPVKAFLALLVVLTLLDAVMWLLGARARDDTMQSFLWSLSVALTWLIPSLTGWFVVRLLDGAVRDRTSGNSLISPWPADGGAPEKQFSAYEKFLPVEMVDRPEPDPAPEASR
jgi:hypothetical protein